MLVHTPAPAVRRGAADERASRRELRRQIAAIERRLEPGATRAQRRDKPRLMTLGELEYLRDALLADEHRAGKEQARARAQVATHRLLLEDMRDHPERHRGRRLALAALGEPGCGVYRVRPRLGLVGMLAGWWELTLSSGCP